MRFTCTFKMEPKEFAESEGDVISAQLDRLMDTLCGTDDPPPFALDAKTPIRDMGGKYIGYWLIEADLP